MLPRTVILLSLVSFLNDAASELITPLLPLFLTATLGAGPWVVGLVEGVAETTASVLKIFSGRLADRGLRHKLLVLSGYTLSNLCRPLIGLAGAWSMVLGLRFLDRVGKGIRTAPRDALIVHTTPPELLGRAFGFHRALDNAGAIAGPIAAFFLLNLGLPMTQVFLWSAVPGVCVLGLLLLGLKEPPRPPRLSPPPLRWHALDTPLKGLILASGGLQLAAAPEVFLVLWATERGLEVAWAPLLWAAASVVKTPISLAGGELSDRIGQLPVLVLGWGMRVGTLIALALAQNGALLTWGLFLGYAAALAMTEGPERALVGTCAPKALRATAFGLYHMTVGLAALPGGVLFGSLWQWGGAPLAFAFSATGTAVSAVVLLAYTRRGHSLRT
ncbi:MAG: MFS transporter [Methylohalobius sp.]